MKDLWKHECWILYICLFLWVCVCACCVCVLCYLTEVQFLRKQLGTGRRVLSERQQGVDLIQERRRLSLICLPQLPLSLKQQALHPAHLHTRKHTDKAWSERIILIEYIDIPIDSELGCLSRWNKQQAQNNRHNLTSLRLSLLTETVRTLLRQPRASVHSSSTNAPTSCDKLPVFSLSSSSSCQSNIQNKQSTDKLIRFSYTNVQLQ